MRQRASRAGIAPEWTDQTGALRQVSPDSLRAILHAPGLPEASRDELCNSLAAVEAPSRKGAIRFVTVRV